MPLTVAEKDALLAAAQAFANAVAALVPDAGTPPPTSPIATVTSTPDAKVRATADPTAPGIGFQPTGAQGTTTGTLTNGFVFVTFPTAPSGFVFASNVSIA